MIHYDDEANSYDLTKPDNREAKKKKKVIEIIDTLCNSNQFGKKFLEIATLSSNIRTHPIWVGFLTHHEQRIFDLRSP